MCENQHAPSHAKEFNHVILVRDTTQSQPQAETAPEAVVDTGAQQVPSAAQAGSSTAVPVPVGSDAPVAGSAAGINADVEMADNAPTATESGRSKVDSLLSDAVNNGASSSSVLKVDGPMGEDTTMEDADTANVDQSLAVSVGERSSPPPAAGSSSMVVV
ncbi:hypothetical protein FRC01_006090 [Tulasnella sp. 417]|nr:hypothetical protein FRC01_006090 [Tulasnella sp. 417]